MKTHQDLKLIVVQTMQEQRILNIENVPKTDVLDSNENFSFTYTVNLPSFFPSVYIIYNFIYFFYIYCLFLIRENII